MKKKKKILATVGSSLGVEEEHMTQAFQSVVKRDVMEGLGKDVMLNPGPGSYDTQI